MIHQLTPWFQLTRGGIPPMKVAGRDLVLSSEVTVPVGQTLDPELIPPAIRRTRLRQFYEQRRVEPVNPGPTMQQYYRERFERLHGGQEAPIAPITPIASRIVAEEQLAGLPSVEVPVEEPKSKPKPKGGK